MTFPNDLDINMHVNNGRFLTIFDLNRVDLFLRTGLAKTMLRQKWRPIVAEHTMSYKKPLKLFETFTVVLELTDWDEKYFYMTHTFSNSERLIAEGTSKGLILAKTGPVPPTLVIETVKALNEPAAR